jgi:hypothetical protein
MIDDERTVDTHGRVYLPPPHFKYLRLYD